jgi:Raf kinase inhibitor-like YbhB/YbcL family protein
MQTSTMRVKSVDREIQLVALGITAVLLLTLVRLPGCRASTAKGGTMNLTSSSLQGNQIPATFTCDGAGGSPQLAWSAPPAGTVSLALIVTDPDAPGRTFVHWVLYDLPNDARELPEALPAQGELAGGGRQGSNDFGNLGYGGPCPPGHSQHHYVFTLYALDTKLNLPPGAARAQVEAAMKGHILASGELVGLYQR